MTIPMRPAATTSIQETMDAVAYAITSGSRCYGMFFVRYTLSLIKYILTVTAATIPKISMAQTVVYNTPSTMEKMASFGK